MLEQYWLADWDVLLGEERVQAGSDDEKTLARVVIEEAERHPFSCVDMAMSRLVCTECTRELGGGYPACGECSLALGWAMGSEQAAQQEGLVNMNEHALHVGRFVLRFAENHSEMVRWGWRTTMPRILTGWLPSTEQAQKWAAGFRKRR